MGFQLTDQENKQIQQGIQKKYAKVAISPENHFKYPTGRAGLKALNYDPKLINGLPDEIISSYCGVGNPFSLGKIHGGEQILDLGCGAGVDTILAAILAGPDGSAVGVDIVPEMIWRAESNLKIANVDNASFHNISGENLPFADNRFDVVISNGVINLIPDKKGALSEIIRVLKPTGRLMVADQVAAVRIHKDIKARLANWFQ